MNEKIFTKKPNQVPYQISPQLPVCNLATPVNNKKEVLREFSSNLKKLLLVLLPGSVICAPIVITVSWLVVVPKRFTDDSQELMN
jgi:hypothetical protein